MAYASHWGSSKLVKFVGHFELIQCDAYTIVTWQPAIQLTFITVCLAVKKSSVTKNKKIL